MDRLELRRADLGFGRVIVDDRGVTRRSFTTRAIGWDQIRDYRLTIELRGHAPDLAYLIDWVRLAVVVDDARRAARGDSAYRLGLELEGDGQRVAFDWRFAGVARAIACVLDRIRPPLEAEARTAFERDGIARFGPLAIARDGVTWARHPMLPIDAVERLELFNSSPVRLRVLANGKVLPYGQAPTARIPNLAGALALAEQLGYPVAGRELLAALATPA